MSKYVVQTLLDFCSKLITQLKTNKPGFEIYKTIEDFDNLNLNKNDLPFSTEYFHNTLKEIEDILRLEGLKYGRDSIPINSPSKEMKKRYMKIMDDLAWFIDLFKMKLKELDKVEHERAQQTQSAQLEKEELEKLQKEYRTYLREKGLIQSTFNEKVELQNCPFCYKEILKESIYCSFCGCEINEKQSK